MTHINYLLVCFGFLAAASGQIIRFGSCPEYQLAQNFSASEYFSGKYYEQKRFWAIFEVGSTCVNAEYTFLSNGTVKVVNSGHFFGRGTRTSQVGEAYCDEDEPASCHVRFFANQPYGDYKVISADPKEYGLVYSCTEVIPRILNVQLAWVLTREKTVADEAMGTYLDIFEQNGISVKPFIDTVQDCSDN